MKKIITIVAALTLIVGALTGCGVDGSSTGKDEKGKNSDSSQTVPPQWKKSLDF